MLFVIRPAEVAAGNEWNTKGSKKSWRNDNLSRSNGVSRIRSRNSGDGVFKGKVTSEDWII
jgi:hypothetical protein